MSQLFLRLLLGLALVTLVDTLGSIASRKLHFKYSSLIPLSLAIYMFFGYTLRTSTDYPTLCALAGIMGLFEGTLGFKISIALKANTKLDKAAIKKINFSRMGLIMAVVCILFASLGYTIGQTAT